MRAVGEGEARPWPTDTEQTYALAGLEAGNASGKANSCHTVLCAARQLLPRTVALLRADKATRGRVSQYQGLEKKICIFKKVARNLTKYQDKAQPSSFPLSLRWDELVILKWKHECDVPLPTTVPTPSSPWIWIMHHWVYFLYLYLKTGWLLNMLLLILCNHTTKLTSTAMACSPGSGIRFTGSSEGGQDSSSSYTYMKACPCFIQHTEMATRPLQISKPSMKVFFLFPSVGN